jgi:hypothetical protein
MKVRPMAGEAGAAREGLAMKASPVAGEANPRDRLWPVLITVGLLLVVLVNVLFIYIAVKGADRVEPSYFTEER